MSDDAKARERIDVTVGESVRIIRELQELSQNQLAELRGMPQSTISAIERNRINLGVERVKVPALRSRSTRRFSFSRAGTLKVNRRRSCPPHRPRPHVAWFSSFRE